MRRKMEGTDVDYQMQSMLEYMQHVQVIYSNLDGR
jgi:hypothetical protein